MGSQWRARWKAFAAIRLIEARGRSADALSAKRCGKAGRLENMARITKLLQDMRASYWFVPGLMMVVAFLLAVGIEALDRHFSNLYTPMLRDWMTTQSDAVRSLLSVIAQSVITVTGVLFSMTVVAVSFASSNFGPRLIGNFMRDRGTQISLGVLISTFVFALATLRSVQDFGADGLTFVPLLSLVLALVMTFASVIVMIYFIHHVPEMINLENLCHKLGSKLQSQLIELCQANGSASLGDEIESDWMKETEGQDPKPIFLKTAGYVQAVDFNQITKTAAENDLSIEVIAVPGQFVHPQRPALKVYSGEPLSESTEAQLRACFATGAGKTDTQNVMFVAQQLVEIIARALSPSVNDPYTACTCLNWLHASLQELAVSETVAIARCPSHHVKIPPVTFHQLLHITHVDSRQYILGDIMVKRHAEMLLQELARQLPPGPRFDAVKHELDTLQQDHQ